MTIELTEITGVEIFRAGVYPQGSFSRADVKQMAASYDPELLAAPLTTDHLQKGPALGWIKNPREEEGVLLADFERVPVEFAEQIKSRAWRNRSLEIFENPEIDVVKKTGGLYIKAVTMLGAATPAVKGLDDIELAEATGYIKCKAGDPFKSVDCNPIKGFAQPTSDPNPGDHGTIVAEHHTSSILDHFHQAFLDENGNGFTGTDLEIDDETFALKSGRTGHIHLVSGGAVQEGGVGPHIHEIFGFTSDFKAVEANVTTLDFSESHPREGEEMNAEDQAKMDALKAQLDEANTKFGAVEANLTKLAGENDTLKAAGEEAAKKAFRESRIATFTAAVDAKITASSISPGEKDALIDSFTATLDAAIAAGAREDEHGAMAACKAFAVAVEGRQTAAIFANDVTKPDAKTVAAGIKGGGVIDLHAPMTQSSSAALHMKVQEVQATHFDTTGKNLDYADAYDRVRKSAREQAAQG